MGNGASSKNGQVKEIKENQQHPASAPSSASKTKPSKPSSASSIFARKKNRAESRQSSTVEAVGKGETRSFSAQSRDSGIGSAQRPSRNSSIENKPPPSVAAHNQTHHHVPLSSGIPSLPPQRQKTSPRPGTKRSYDLDPDPDEEEPLLSSQTKSFVLVLAAGASESGKRPRVLQLRTRRVTCSNEFSKKVNQPRAPLGSKPGQTGKNEERVDAGKVLDSLRKEGFLNQPETHEAKAGVCYTVPLGELQPAKKKPPPRLQKMERQNQMEVTRQNIKEKLEKAERRRKKREQEKIERSREKDARNLEVKLALLEIEKNREKELRKQVDLNVSSHIERRSRNVDEIKEKQRQHDLKVSEAQRRKLLSPRPDVTNPAEISMMTPQKSPRNLDDLPVPALSRASKNKIRFS